MNHISTNNTKQARADLLENLMVEVEKVFVGKRFVLELILGLVGTLSIEMQETIRMPFQEREKIWNGCG